MLGAIYCILVPGVCLANGSYMRTGYSVLPQCFRSQSKLREGGGKLFGSALDIIRHRGTQELGSITIRKKRRLKPPCE